MLTSWQAPTITSQSLDFVVVSIDLDFKMLIAIKLHYSKVLDYEFFANTTPIFSASPQFLMVMAELLISVLTPQAKLVSQ